MQNVWIKSPLLKNNIISNKVTASPKNGLAVFMFDVIFIVINVVANTVIIINRHIAKYTKC